MVWLERPKLIGILLLAGILAAELSAQEKPGGRSPRVNVFVDPFRPYGPAHDGIPHGSGFKPHTRIHVINRAHPLPLSPSVALFTAEFFQQQSELAFSRTQYDQAVRFVHHAFIEDGNDGRLHLLLSHCLFASGEYQNAANSLIQGLGLLDRKEWGHFLVSNSRIYATGEHARRLRHLDAYVRTHPRIAQVYVLRGYHLLFSGARAAAQADLELAILIDPDFAIAKQLLALNQHQHSPEQLPPPLTSSERSQYRQ